MSSPNPDSAIRPIPLADIEVDEANVRKSERNVDIDDLAANIKKYGLLQPVALLGQYGKPPYRLIIGQRRLLAHKRLGAKSIPAVFVGEKSEREAKILSLIENMHRVELPYSDVANAVMPLYEELKDDRKVARELRLPLRKVRDYIRIEELASNKATRMLDAKKISRRDVRRVIDASHGDRAKADRLLSEIVRLSTYEKMRLREYGQTHPEANAATIVREARKPKVREQLVLNLTAELHGAVTRAAAQLAVDNEELAMKALEEWLVAKGYLVRKK